MIEVHLYGRLRRFAEKQAANADSVMRMPVLEGETVGDLADRIGIPREEIGRNIFLNGKLCALTRPIENGDRLGLFPTDMTLLYRQYFPVHE